MMVHYMRGFCTACIHLISSGVFVRDGWLRIAVQELQRTCVKAKKYTIYGERISLSQFILSVKWKAIELTNTVLEELMTK